jgi:hypothetical protein
LSGNIYGGASGGDVYYSVTPYSNWNIYGANFPNSQVLDVVFSDGIMFAATLNSGIYKCSHKDSAWVAVNTGLPGMYVTAMAADGNKLFAAITGNGVFVSVDKGAHWVNTSDGLTNLNVISLTVFDGYLYAGTSGAGLWKRALSEMTLVIEMDGANYFSVFPTLTKDKISIQSSIEEKTSIQIFDISGKCVYKSEFTKPHFSIDVSELENGMYVVRLGNGSKMQYQKFIKY